MVCVIGWLAWVFSGGWGVIISVGGCGLGWGFVFWGGCGFWVGGILVCFVEFW